MKTWVGQVFYWPRVSKSNKVITFYPSYVYLYASKLPHWVLIGTASLLRMMLEFNFRRTIRIGVGHRFLVLESRKWQCFVKTWKAGAKIKQVSAGFKAGLSEVNRFLNVALKRLLLKAYKKGLSAVLREKTLIKGQRGHENWPHHDTLTTTALTI